VVARRVFLHIGAPKTGTTYLQRVLDANRDVLARHGLLYATGGSSRDRVWATEVLRGIDLSRHPRPQAAGAWDRILDEVKRWEGTAVVSHEFFGACSADQAERALRDLEPCEVHLVFTARDYVSLASAVWQERLKYGHATRFSDFRLDTAGKTPMWSWQTQDLLAILARWQHHLPPSRVHVVTVPRGGRPDALWERFASVVGVDPSVASPEVSGANTSLGLVEAELLRRVDERAHGVLSGPREHARWTRDLLANTVLSQGSRERFSVSGPYAEELATRSHEAVSGIVAAGYDVVGTLEDLLAPDPLPVTRSPDDASAEELLDAAITGIVGLLADAKQTRLRHQAQVKLLRAGRGAQRRARRRAARSDAAGAAPGVRPGRRGTSLRRLLAGWWARRPGPRR
jgi:hypothetical protein